MRVTFTQINDMVQRNISNNYSKLANLQEQLSTGRRLNRPSDDPVDMKNNLNYKAEIAQNDQFKRNIEDGSAWISMTMVSMQDMNTLVQDLRVSAEKGSNDTLTANDRQYIAQEVNQILGQLVGLTNSSYKGNFIFGGTNGDKQIYKYEEKTNYSFAPTNPAAPAVPANTFQVGVANAMTSYADGKITQLKRLDPGTVSLSYSTVPAGVATTAVEGTDYTIDYAQGTINAVAGSAFETALSGGLVQVNLTFNHYYKVNQENMGSIYREISETEKPRINMSADEIFEDPANNLDMIGVAVDLINGLKSNSGSKISNAISEIDKIIQKLSSAQSINGAKKNRFDTTLDRNSSQQIEVTRLQSNLEDLDFAEAIMSFSMSQNVYTASLQAGARVILPTLGDYI